MKPKISSKTLNSHFELNANMNKEDVTKQNEGKNKKLLNSENIKPHLLKLQNRFYNSIGIILFVFILSILPEEFLSIEYYTHYIKLKVCQNGYQQILSDRYFGENPSLVYVNNKLQILREKKVFIEDTNYEIKLVWDHVISNFRYMFYNITNITSVHMNYIFGKDCNLSYTFFNCQNLMDFTYDNDPNSPYVIYDTISMFYNCTSLTYFSFSDFYIGSINSSSSNYYRNMSYMFYNCQSLNSTNYPKKDILYIGDMRGMFYNCTNLKEIILEKFKTGPQLYSNSSYMFYNCSSLESFKFLSTFHTSDMNSMFYNCISLTSINLNNITTNNNINISRLFYNCSNLAKIENDFNNVYINDAIEMFYNCTSLEYYKNESKIYLSITTQNNNNEMYKANMSNMFYNCISLKNVYIEGNIYPSDLHSIFYNCNSLLEVTLDKFSLEYTGDMSYMFYNCKKFQTFNRNNFISNSTKVAKRSMEGMFQNCEALSTLNLNNDFNSKNVDNMFNMFKGCKNLKNLNIENSNSFDTSQVTDMESMFEGCSSLVSLDLNSFNTTKVQYMNKMFYNCEKLESLDFSSISANSLGTMRQMFFNCKSLTYLNLFSLTEKEQSISEMFEGASVNFTFCIEDSDKIPNIFAKLLNMTDTKRDCSKNCYRQKERVEIQSKKLCCPNVKYNEICYDNCPSKTRDMNNNNTCINFTCPYEGLNSDYIYYNYNQSDCLNHIPIGYFLNDTNLSTIDKCHEDCESCDEKETDSNHTNCITCKKGYIYLGNCYDNCSRGFDSQGVCKCFDERCLRCAEENIKKGLCDTCETNYYSKSDNQKAPFDCFKDPEKYYLSESEKFYYPCYPSCQTCKRGGDKDIHNCLTCNANNTFNLSRNGYFNCYPKCTYLFYFNEENEYTCASDDKCPKTSQLIIPDISQCIDSCNETDDYQYEFNNKCYRECPGDSVILDKEKKTCRLSCPFERPFMLKSLVICVSNCTINDREIKECVTNYEGNRTNAEIQDLILNDIMLHLISSKYNFSVIKERKIVIEENSANYELTTTQSKENNNKTSSINISQCEDTLRTFYSIGEQEILYILKYDIFVEGVVNPTVRYKIYYPLEDPNILEPLDLILCEDLPVTVSYPANLTDDIFLYDKNSSYYKDLCAPYSFDGGYDITLKDRQNAYIENNRSLCEEDCSFVGYDQETSKVKCSCEIKITLPLVSEIKIDKDKLYTFMNIKNIANFDVLKCWNLIISFKGLLKNIGFYSYMPTLITLFITLIIFYAKEYRIIKNQITDIVYAKTFIKYLKKKKPIKPKVKKKLSPKFVPPIAVQMHENKIEFEKNLKNLDPNKKRKKTSIISKIFGKAYLPKSINNLEIIKEDLIEENNIDNINNDLILDKEKIPGKRLKTLQAPPKKETIFKGINMKRNSSKTEANSEENEFSFSQNNLDNIKRKMQTTYNDSKDYDNNVILGEEEKEKIKNIMERNDSELNNLDYKEALELDKRSYSTFYFSLLKTNHLFVRVFTKTDYNSRIIKIFLITFNFSLSYLVNALFFNDGTMHKILEDKGDYNFIYQLPQIAYSTVISFVIESFLNFLALSEEDVLSIKQEKVAKKVKGDAEEVLRKLQIKFLIFFILSFCSILIFWYYVACFCAVYVNTQYHLMSDSLISFGSSQITPFGISLIPAIFRIYSLKSRKQYFFILSKIFQLLL